MKKALISSSLILCIAISGCSLSNSTGKTTNKPKATYEASYPTIKGLDELKKESTTIVEVVGTDKYKIVDDKGIEGRVTTVKVTDVLKGDKNLTEINIIQAEGMDTEVPPANGEKLLMFLRNGVPVGEFKMLYVPLGGTQGIYKIKVKDNKKYFDYHCMKNSSILKELSGNYEDVKLKIKK